MLWLDHGARLERFPPRLGHPARVRRVLGTCRRRARSQREADRPGCPDPGPGHG
jgi:hypothetical protein